MIPDRRFTPQLSTVHEILAAVGLLEERMLLPNKRLSVSRFRSMSYREVYEECVKEFAYDFRLSDQSLLAFLKGGKDVHDGWLSFSYYECPVSVMEYREFVGAENDITILDPTFDEIVDVWGDELRPNYEQYVNSLESKSIVTPIRYDYKACDYRPGVHPASHVHFGFLNEIRVGTGKVMNPISFTLMIIRQRYPAAWERILTMRKSPYWCRNVRTYLAAVDKAYMHRFDQHELQLN
jgi:hypothetical protein